MSTRSKSFWSTIPGLITGLAGILTAVVGLGTLLIQVGVVGGDGSDDPTTGRKSGSTVTTLAPGARSGDTEAVAKLDVSPTAVDLTVTDKTESVTVENSGSKALSLQQPALSGAGKDQFEVKNGCSQLQAGDSCNVTVTFKGLSEASATMMIRGSDGVSKQVSLEGSLL